MIYSQFIKYSVVGIISNGLLYVAYLFLTTYGLGHKTSMTLLYVLGVLQTFFLNKKWTFAIRGAIPKSFARYCFSYTFGFLVNLLALYYFVDHLLFSHKVVQGIMILFNAILLFILQKFWVFNHVKPKNNVNIHSPSLKRRGNE